MDYIDAKKAISTMEIKLWDKVMTPYGTGRAQFLQEHDGEIYLVVSQGRQDLPQGETIRGIWRLVKVSLSEVTRLTKAGLV